VISPTAFDGFPPFFPVSVVDLGWRLGGFWARPVFVFVLGWFGRLEPALGSIGLHFLPSWVVEGLGKVGQGLDRLHL
jgi:hypothetical protein